MEPAHWKKGFTSNIDYVELYYLDLFHMTYLTFLFRLSRNTLIESISSCNIGEKCYTNLLWKLGKWTPTTNNITTLVFVTLVTFVDLPQMKKSIKQITQRAAYYNTSKRSWYPKPEETILFSRVPSIKPLPVTEMSQTNCDVLRNWAFSCEDPQLKPLVDLVENFEFPSRPESKTLCCLDSTWLPDDIHVSNEFESKTYLQSLV